MGAAKEMIYIWYFFLVRFKTVYRSKIRGWFGYQNKRKYPVSGLAGAFFIACRYKAAQPEKLECTFIRVDGTIFQYVHRFCNLTSKLSQY